MRIKLLFSQILVFAFIIILDFSRIENCNVRFHSTTEKLAEINGYFQFEFNRTVNPYSGILPSKALLNAFKTLQERGFYKTNLSTFANRSSGWQPINDFFSTLSITKIAFDATNPTTFYFCTGEGFGNAEAVKGAGLWKSIDAGATWAQLASTNNSKFDYCLDMGVHSSTGAIYVATLSAGVQRSIDGGETWQKVLGIGAGSLKNSACEVEITSDGGIYIGIGVFETDGIYYSSTGDSASFTKQTNGFPTTGIYRIKLASAPSNPDVAIAIACATDFKIKGIYKTIDRGLTWQMTALPDNNLEMAARQAWYDLSLAIDPNNEQVIVAGGLDIWRSRDGGDQWQRISAGRLDSTLIRYVHVDQHEIVFQSSDIVYFGNDGGIWRCDNFTSEQPFIFNLNDGYNVTQFYAVDQNPNPNNDLLIGGTQDNGSLLAYSPAFKEISGGDGAFVAYNTLDDQIFYSASQYRPIFRFTNGGYEKPDSLKNNQIDDANALFINPFEIDPKNPEVLYQASNIGLWRLDSASTAGPEDWEKAVTFGGVISAISMSVNPPDYCFIGRRGSNGAIYKIYDPAHCDPSFIPINIDPLDMLPNVSFGEASLYCSNIGVDANDANHLLVTFSNYGVNSIWESTNALGDEPTWQSVEGDLPDIPVYWSIIHPNNASVCYIATEMGVFYTNNLNGSITQWLPVSNFPLVKVNMLRLRLNDLSIAAATHGRGIWSSTLSLDAINNDISWVERGPTNVGGRTRTIMIDPNDESGQLIWAGSASGGLWRAADINAVAVEPAIQIAQDQFSVSPNPVSKSGAVIQIDFELSKQISLQLFNSNGFLCEQIYNGEKSSELASFFWKPNYNLKTGTYFIVLLNGQKKWVQKIVIL